MKLHTAPVILSVAVIASLLLPAGALIGTMGAPSEDVFDGEPSVEIAAHDGPNGDYVEKTGDGEVRIDLADSGVNTNALTGIKRVFDIRNTDTTDVTVWVTHNGDENVTLYDDTTGDPIERANESVTLESGEEITVSIDIDSRGVSAGEELLSTVTLHAGFEAEGEESVTQPGTGDGAGSNGAPEPVEPPEPIESVELDGDVEVIFEDGTSSGVEVRRVDIAELEDDPAENIDRPPIAVISSEYSEARGTDAPGDEAFDTMTLVGESVELSGERSTIGAAEAVSNRDRITQLVDIEVPPERKDQPATVRMRIDRDRLGDVDPEETMIGHRTDEGWELLETRVVDQTEESVIVAAETPGFSMFAVFSPPDVGYEWERSDGAELEGEGPDPCVCVTPTFDDPGFYEIQLTVTDRLDRQNTTTHRVLANDVPKATIEVVDRDGDQVTLAANVSDEIGETEITWTFPDGTEATGEEVTHTFNQGEHGISLHVIDEYGAESETEHTIAIGPPGASAEAVADALGMDLELVVQMGIVSGIGLALAIGYRQFPWRIFAWRRRQGPKITVFEAPRIDAETGQFVIDELTIEDPSSELETITISVIDDQGRTVMRKELDISGETTYIARPETLLTPPGTGIDPDGGYTVRVEAYSVDGGDTERDRTILPDSGHELGTGSSDMRTMSTQ